jgi:hypothetical protein
MSSKESGLSAAFALIALVLSLSTEAATWVPIQGNVRLADGTPVCAMVLANGEYMFSCDGTGAYRLNVPLDSNGDITLHAFADGFAPFSVTTGPGTFPYTVQMNTATQGSPEIVIGYGGARCVNSSSVNVYGIMMNDAGTALCGMVLANGHYVFSCDANNPGAFEFSAPLDPKDEVTVQAFADGFQPYKLTYDATPCTQLPAGSGSTGSTGSGGGTGSTGSSTGECETQCVTYYQQLMGDCDSDPSQFPDYESCKQNYLNLLYQCPDTCAGQ